MSYAYLFKYIIIGDTGGWDLLGGHCLCTCSVLRWKMLIRYVSKRGVILVCGALCYSFGVGEQQRWLLVVFLARPLQPAEPTQPEIVVQVYRATTASWFGVFEEGHRDIGGGRGKGCRPQQRAQNICT